MRVDIVNVGYLSFSLSLQSLKSQSPFSSSALPLKIPNSKLPSLSLGKVVPVGPLTKLPEAYSSREWLSTTLKVLRSASHMRQHQLSEEANKNVENGPLQPKLKIESKKGSNIEMYVRTVKRLLIGMMFDENLHFMMVLRDGCCPKICSLKFSLYYHK